MAKKVDNITKILKSITPIRNPLSKISRQLNLSFKQASLENLLKTLDKKVVSKNILLPTSNKIYFKNDYDIDFHHSIEYLNEFADIHNLPLVEKDKNYVINGNFNSDYEKEKIKAEKSKKFFLKLKEEKKNEKIKNIKNSIKFNNDNDSDLIFGNYNPNYDVIKPRLPNVLIRNPNAHIKDFWSINCPFRNTFKDFKINLKEINKDDKVFKNKRKINKIQKNNSFNNCQISLFDKKTEESFNTQNLDYLNNKPITKIKIKKIKRIKNNKLYLDINNIKGTILFDKMKRRKSLFKKCESNIDYYPNYEFTFPHTPSYIFKYINSKERHKKYMNGKIIRGYKFDPEDYYVMKLRKKQI